MSLPCFTDAGAGRSVPIVMVQPDRLDAVLEQEGTMGRAWAQTNRFQAKAGQRCLIPTPEGGLAKILFGLGSAPTLWTFGGLAKGLPRGTYSLSADTSPDIAWLAALGWAFGSYRFSRYKGTAPEATPVLQRSDGIDWLRLEAEAAATWVVRDLVNTPANDMGPEALENVVADLSTEFGGAFRSIVGNALLEENYPIIHAVGRASTQEPRLLDLRWGAESSPKVTLVGKGVCFDTGGLDLKPSNGMLNMKKDMGGAAHVIGLARMIMETGLPVRLRVLIPAVENMIAGNAFRPLDVLTARNGKTVEVGNTDAEGRLVLADALVEADSETPEVLIDFATLTGAARVALGPELPALLGRPDEIADGIVQSGMAVDDPAWRLPLWDPYRKKLSSPIADLNNTGEGGMAGAITAALFLEAFVSENTAWVHLDTFAWNSADSPGRPKGGEAMGMRAAFAYLEDRYRPASDQG